MPRPSQLHVPPSLSVPAVPRWARGGTSGDGLVRDSEEVAFQTGAALAMLHARVMAEAPFAGVWRRRLALKAAAASARMARRGEDEEMLRDAFYLRNGAEDARPAGRLLVAWRACDRSSALDDDAIMHVVDVLQLKKDDALRGAIAGAQQQARSDRGTVFAAAETAKLVLALRPDAEIVALWLADAVLATRCGWPLPLPLIAQGLLHPPLRTDGKRPYPGAAKSNNQL
jgi:Protein of unknown function (DUF1403)